MRFECSKVEFAEYDFMRLFLSTLVSKECMEINRFNLCYELYHFKCNDEYKELFQDISVVSQIEGKFLCLEDSILEAAHLGLIRSFYNKCFILLTSEEAKSIIESYNQNYSSKMDDMVDEYLKSKINKNQNRNVKYKKLVK